MKVMKLYLPIVFILILANGFSQRNEYDTTIITSDWCLTNDSTKWVTITKTIKVIHLQSFLKNKIEEDINFCFRSTPNTCYTIRLSKQNQDSYMVSSELDFPIESDKNITGVVFVNFVPVFLVDINVLDSNLFVETSKLARFERTTINQSYMPCILTDTFPYQFSGSLETKLYHFVINSCNRSKPAIDTDEKRKKMKKKCKK